MIGLLGGRFDPPHNGHVALARTAMERLGLDRLCVTVVVAPGHKETVAPAEYRLELARLGVATRPGYTSETTSPRIEIFELEPYPVSSSELRARVRRGESIEGLVPDAVARRIAELGLYRDA